MAKTKAARYDVVGIEEMIPGLWSLEIVAYDKNAMLGIHHWGPKLDKQFGYRYFKEIMVRRADKKEYKFREVDFSRLHLNDIEDMFKKRVEDVKLRVESYQKKLNITRLQTIGSGLSYKEPYIPFHDSRGVIFLTKNNQKKLKWADELFKFSDGTLKSVREVLHYRLKNFKLGYNDDMPKRKRTEKDKNQIATIHSEIDDLLLERQIIWSLEYFIGGRNIKTDLRLLTRTE
ncbi:hypothetical protein Tco_0378579 [Tanacetum coccineum]